MKRLIKYFIVFVVIFVSEDSLLFGINRSEIFIYFRYLLYFGILFYLLINYEFRINIKLFVPLGIILLSYFVTMLLNSDVRPGYLIGFAVVLLAALISDRIAFKDFLLLYSKILYFLSLISLIVYAVVIIYPHIIHFFPTVYNYNDVEYRTLVICNITNKIHNLKNIGIFREPGVHVIYLLFGVIIELYYNNEINYKRLAVFIATIITTFSTAGYMILAFLMFVYILKTNNKPLKIGLLVLAILFITFFYNTLIISVFEKFNSESNQHRSMLARVSSIMIPFLIFIHHIYGVGLSDFGSYYKSYSIKYFGIAFNPGAESTNTILNTFAIFGILYGILIIYALVKFSKLFGSTKLNFLIVLISVFMISCTQELRFSLFFNLLIMYGIINKKSSTDGNSIKKAIN